MVGPLLNSSIRKIFIKISRKMTFMFVVVRPKLCFFSSEKLSNGGGK